MVVSEGDILVWLGRFLWPFLRITGLFLTAPVFGSPMIPMRVKAVLAAALAAALALWLPDLPAFPADPFSAVYVGIVQIGYGAAIGLVMQIVVVSVAGMGEVAGLSMGLSFAELQFQDVAGSTQVLFDLMTWTGLMGYMALGGPVWLFGAIAHSFAAGTGVEPGAWLALLRFGSVVTTTAVLLAVPVLATGLVINVTVGLLTVFSPQLNLLTIGFPILILGGLSMLTLTLGSLPSVIKHLLAGAARTIATMTGHG